MPKVYNKYDKKTPEDAKYIGRGSLWGNPFVIGQDGTREQVIEKYKEWLDTQPELKYRAIRVLRGKDLVCFCAPKACHGDVLLELANKVGEEYVNELQN